MNNTTYPRGVLYVIAEEAYIGIDNRDGSVVDQEFDGFHECHDWLRVRM
jgi:hypothetical protein